MQSEPLAKVATAYHCGPVEIVLHASDSHLAHKLAETFELYTVRWPDVSQRVVVRAERAKAPPDCSGSYLSCARMRVDEEAAELVARCASGVSARSASGRSRWRITAPPPAEATVPEDIEDLAGLVLTTAWRDSGHVPLHVACVLRGEICVLVCAPSGGGKSTLTTALLREGWSTLGDDKILLTEDADGFRLRAVIDRFNLHPQSQRWFPELGDLSQLPRYSAWTEKRKVSIGSVWKSAFRAGARPTHLVQLDRQTAEGPLRVDHLASSDILPTLLRQTVIPTESRTASRLLGVLARLARDLEGMRVTCGRDAFLRPGWTTPLEAALA